MNNVVAKIMIVLQLVFSICFMCFAGAVYSFQKGWRDKAGAAQQQLSEREADYKRVSEEKTDLEKELRKQIADRTTDFEVAQSQVQTLRDSLASEERKLAATEQERDKHRSDLLVAQSEADARVLEANTLRKDVETLRNQLNEGIAQRRELDGAKLELQSELEERTEREEYLHSEIARLRDLCRLNKVDPEETFVGIVPAAIEKVDGVVRQSKKNTSRTVELVEISVGTDDGIGEKMKLIVYRGRRFICEIEITDVYPDMAVGRVLEETRNGSIERGDNVTTKL